MKEIVGGNRRRKWCGDSCYWGSCRMSVFFCVLFCSRGRFQLQESFGLLFVFFFFQSNFKTSLMTLRVGLHQTLHQTLYYYLNINREPAFLHEWTLGDSGKGKKRLLAGPWADPGFRRVAFWAGLGKRQRQTEGDIGIESNNLIVLPWKPGLIV